jgi:hypothetical protein
MPPTKREIDNWMQRQAKVVQSDPTLLRLVTSAVVSTERLTGLPEWDQFLQRLQPLLNEATAATQEWLVRLSGAMTDQDLRIAQMNYHACQSRVTTLQEVMQLPNEILKARSQADHNTPAVGSTITDARGDV